MAKSKARAKAKDKAKTKAEVSASRANSRPNRRKPMSPEPTTKGSASNPAPAAAAASPERASASVRYVDRADMVETFFRHRFDLRWSDIADRVWRHPFRRRQAQCADHRPPLSGLPLGVAAGRGRRSHQSHAANRGGADASRRGESSAAARSVASEGRLTGGRTIACCLNEDASGCHGSARVGNRRTFSGSSPPAPATI